MSFLTPLYLLGALAVGLPILFHLIRRTPRGRQVFSSLMFLEPSPPRVTRRSRIEDWLLLCLRALAICLLAAAFARPFLRQPAAAGIDDSQGRWMAVLLDTSASMRREGLWDEAAQQLSELLDSAAPGDRIAVYTFDAAPQLRFGWDAWTRLDPGERAAAAQSAVREIQPGWLETNLGAALILAADSLEDAAGQEVAPAIREIVVISDFQSGSRLEALQGYTWPDDVSVRVTRVGSEAPATNAAVHAVAAGEGDDDSVLRVRVTNAANSERETFRVEWVDEFATPGAEPEDTVGVAAAPSTNAGLDVYVAPGQSRVVRAPERPGDAAASRLVLHGDDHVFDNTCYVAGGSARDVTIVVLSSDDPVDPAGQRFYVEPMFPGTRDRTVHVVDWEFESSALPLSEHGIQLVLLLEAPRPDQIAALREYIHGGGLVWYVLRAADDAATLAAMAGVPELTAAEAEVSDYAMLSDMDFSHPVFAPFADPRFSDFTSLRFWRHRRVDAGQLPDAQVLARFDDGDPALGELELGEGSLIFLTSSWARSDSQLALWSKFVPLANALLEYGGGLFGEGGQYVVGDTIVVGELTSRAGEYTRLRRPDGSVEALPPNAPGLGALTEPGLYALLTADDDADRTLRFAVNLPPAESRTDPLTTDALEAADVRLTGNSSAAVEQANADRERQLQNRELEQQQKLWRWLLIAAVAVLIVETLLAGRLTGLRRSQPLEPER
jgi:hypothetical protein